MVKFHVIHTSQLLRKKTEVGGQDKREEEGEGDNVSHREDADSEGRSERASSAT